MAQKPPATRPDNLSNDIKKLWDHLELCWNIDPQKRPSAADAINFLEENAYRIVRSLSMSHLREEPVPSLTGLVENSPKSRSPVIDLLESIGVTNLTGQVTDIPHRPIFTSAFSDVYKGVSEGKFVCLILLIRHLSLSGSLDCRQVNTHCGFQGNHG